MKSKFLDTLFDNILIWLGPRKRKRKKLNQFKDELLLFQICAYSFQILNFFIKNRDDVQIGEYDSEYPRIPDPQKKLFKSADSFNPVVESKQVSQNGSLMTSLNDENPEVTQSVIPVKTNTSPRKEAQYLAMKKEYIDLTKENSNKKNKNPSSQKVTILVDSNNTSKKNDQQHLYRKDKAIKDIYTIGDDGQEIPFLKEKQYEQRRQSAAQFQIEQYRQERENIELELAELPEIFMEFKSVTDEWIESDLDLIEQKMANLNIRNEQIKANIMMIFFIEQQAQEKRKERCDDKYQTKNIFNARHKQKSTSQLFLEEFNTLYDLKTKKQKPFFWRFQLDQLKQVQDVFDQSYNLNQDVVVHPHILEKLSFTNLQTLSKTCWLNDEVINAFIRLIISNTNAVVLNTFFYPELVKNTQWNKIKRIANKNNVSYKNGSFFVPMNINGNHWSFAEVNNDTNKVIYYDSLASQERDYSQYTRYFLDLMSNLQKEDGIPADKIKQYQLITGCTGIQKNGYDCGIFMLKGVHYRSSGITGLDLWIDQCDTNYYRYLIAYQLIQGKIETNGN